jgi:sterol desaturase/sphingolipid hydroxylase (fatty acid hydroxylase superfamily)
VISNFSLAKLHEISRELSGGPILVYLLAFDWRNLNIWQFLALPSLLITVFIYFFSDRERIAWEINSAAIPQPERISWLKGLTATRNSFTFLSLALAIGYVLLALWLLASKTNLEQLPPVLTFLKTLYGDYIKLH